MSAPLLRFGEFAGEWSQVVLEDLAEVERGKFSVRPRNDPRYFGGSMPFVQTGDVACSDTYLKGYSQTLNADGIKVSKVFPEDTILITIAANIGDTTITQYPIACPDSVVAIQPKKDLANTIFLKNIIDLKKDFLDSQATQNAQKNINLQVLKPLELMVPNLNEQTKIASLLSAVDEKISQLNQKHALLSKYKQGMMQKLFSQQIRFKADDGGEFGEWEDKNLNEMGENIIGLTYSPNDVTTDGSGILVLRSSNIKKGRLDKNDQVRVSKSIKERIIIKPNDILICARNGSQRLIGKSVLINDSEEMTFGAFMSVYRSKYNHFISYLMQSPWFFEQVQMNLGARINQITTGTLNEFTFDFPELEEQTKIANFLSAIDQKIEVVAQQIQQAKQWKKGLLQQMFV